MDDEFWNGFLIVDDALYDAISQREDALEGWD